MASHFEDVTNNHNEKKSNNEMDWIEVLQRYIPIVLVFSAIIVVMSYFISPLSRVGTITVEGNQVVYDQNIIDQSTIRGGDSLLETIQNKETISKEIVDGLDQVKSSEFTVEDFNNIVIMVEEFDTVAYIADETNYLRVLENGAVLEEEYTVSIGNQPVLTKFEEGEALNLMIEELGKVDAPILNLISEIELMTSRSNPLFIRVYMNNGNRVLSSIPEFSEKILYYPQMIQAVNGQKGIFDMEVGVYFTPFVDGESEESGLLDEERQALEEFNE